ncbi:MAG TPA: DnaJ domain-containing protein [Spirochaetota bacterium]|nr:DnaJ domain-containing protein [Spirochaetota bacterium]HPC41192.1 DnaJ domain-containing protein [Spirochaetota bacterium]HPL17133.1 DnaJ domain-containing protein [Spirochaetota bacterium]HQF07112.1 DnaJ domain-containing protein [Spirochaetota bacterium]HQH95849.1 DnaJ domain-containing protein [Spirochaetota bacterium]
MNPHRSESGLRLIEFDTGKIFALLESYDRPVMEADLLRTMTGEARFPSGREKLFELHFSFYHALYRLKREAGALGYYLHLDPMRIRMARVPGAGSCHHYDPETGSHCGLDAGGGAYCSLHRLPGSDGAVTFDPLLDFYTNPDNLSFGTSALLEKLMKGAVIYALRRGEVERALELFGISRPTMKNIKRKYHELAKSLHPDLNRDGETEMKKLNHAYQVLMEVFAI